MKKNLILLPAFVLSCGLVSCSSDNEDDLGEGKQVVNLLADQEPIMLTAKQKQFANDNNNFTLNFLKTANEADQSGKSFIYSPLSITYVLGMVNAAAIGETEKELEQTLGFREGGIQAVNEYCRKLIEGLPKADKKATLNIANALFVNKNMAKLKSQYQKDMQTYYDAKVENLDFKSSSTLGTINGWVNKRTNGMIPTILDEINLNVVAYLLNAIYFKADWASKFDPKNTNTETFHPEYEYLMDITNPIKLPLMHQNVLVRYGSNELFSAVKIPYGNGLWNMMVLLPEEGKTIEDVIDYLATYGLGGVDGVHCIIKDGLATMMDSTLKPYEVDLKLPRFETNSDTNDIKDGLIGLLEKMGIIRVFHPNLAEIPNMCEESVYVSMIRQKAAIKVNEEGAEAAAVTAAAVSNNAQAYPNAVFHANRPFVYVISEASSGVILFVGRFTGV